MRIISGTFKNRRVTPSGLRRIAPTTEYIRELVFSIIGPERIKGTNFLDLFCGTGAVGLEALSRGASMCTFVDNDARLVTSLTSLIKEWELTERASVVCSDAAKWITETAFSTANDSCTENRHVPFDFVYAHPPYYHGNQDKYRTLIGYLFAAISETKSLFTENSLLFLEIPRSELGELPSKSGAAVKRSKLKLNNESMTTQYKQQFDSPWNFLLRSLSIPLEFPLYDWRVTSATGILIFGAHADEPTREII